MAETLFEVEEIPMAPEIEPFVYDGPILQDYETYPGKLPIETDYERMCEVLAPLYDAYVKKEYPYNLDKVRVPQDERHIPPPEILEPGSLDHANFLFVLCYYMRGGNNSNDAARMMSKVYTERPDLFDNERILQRDPDEVKGEIKTLLKDSGLGYYNVVPDEWLENARRMKARYDGDPRKIFAGVSDYEEALRRVCNDGKGGGFKGFQEKMTSMLLYYLIEADMAEHFIFPVPVDVHVMRVSIATGMIRFPGVPNYTDIYKPETTAALREMYYRYALEQNVDPLDLSTFVWQLSRTLCSNYPGNITREPYGRDKREGTKTVFAPTVINTSDRAQVLAYNRSCRRCPISKYCTLTLPSKPYTVRSKLAVTGERTEFPPLAQVELDLA
jgi:hypothetical protein